MSARSAQRADTLTLHLPGAPAPEVGRLPGPEEAAVLLGRDLRALRALVLRTGTAGAGVAQVRNRLLGYRDEENPAAASAPVRDVFRGIGEAARAVMGLRIALDGPQDESDDSPATARSREELDAEDAAIDAEEAEEAEETKGLQRPTTRAAVQVSVGSTLAIVGGELLSTDRWYWAVLTCWIVFINTASTGEILVKGYRRLLGTVFGVVAGILLAGLVGGHTLLAFVLVLVLIFAMFYTAPLSYTLMSFFVTAMLGLLYTLLHTYSWEVLVLRVEETALGAVCGVVAAALVLPVRTDRRTNDLLVTVLERLSDVTDAAVAQLSGGPADELLDKARELDQALGDLRSATKPLTHPVTLLRARRTTARYVVALLETCAYHARSLAATAELLPTHPSIAADPVCGARRAARYATSARSPPASPTTRSRPRWRRVRASPPSWRTTTHPATAASRAESYATWNASTRRWRAWPAPSTSRSAPPTTERTTAHPPHTGTRPAPSPTAAPPAGRSHRSARGSGGRPPARSASGRRHVGPRPAASTTATAPVERWWPLGGVPERRAPARGDPPPTDRPAVRGADASPPRRRGPPRRPRRPHQPRPHGRPGRVPPEAAKRSWTVTAAPPQRPTRLHRASPVGPPSGRHHAGRASSADRPPRPAPAPAPCTKPRGAGALNARRRGRGSDRSAPRR